MAQQAAYRLYICTQFQKTRSKTVPERMEMYALKAKPGYNTLEAALYGARFGGVCRAAEYVFRPARRERAPYILHEKLRHRDYAAGAQGFGRADDQRRA